LENFTPKQIAGVNFFAVRFGTPTPKRKAVVKSSLFVLETLLQNEKRKSTFRFSFLKLLLQSEEPSHIFAFRFANIRAKRKAKVNTYFATSLPNRCKSM
jgi:hypothetical protein